MSGRLYLHCWEHRSDSYTVLLWSRSIAVTLSVLIRAVLTLPNSSPQLASEGAAARTESTDSVRIVLMRPVPIAAVAVWLAAAGGGLKAAPFAGLDQAAGVYVTVDGHGITIRQSAVDWDFYVPDGSKAKWKKGRGFGEGRLPAGGAAGGRLDSSAAGRYADGFGAQAEGAMESVVALDLGRQFLARRH